MSNTDNKEFDVLLSFAGPERDYARAIHDIVTANGLSVFLDEEFQHEVWGTNLVEYLHRTYRERGTYVIVLISAAYRESTFTRVERRAAFDQMIKQTKEYLLPVKVDDSWIDGLPTSTAYLDLRVHGVLGVCENLVRKIYGRTQKLFVPPAVHVPRVPLGRIPGDLLATYLLELCSRPQVTAFGALIYDESCAKFRKLLRDRDYWDALDKVSGPHFEVFTLRDIEEHGVEVDSTIEMLTATSLSGSRSRGYYFSRLLKEYFGENKTRLVYPSFLLFLVEHSRVKYCRLIPFRRASIDDTFEWLSALLSAIANGIEDAGGPTVSADILWEQLKTKLLDLDYRLYIQKVPTDAGEAIRQLAEYVNK